VLVQEVFIRAFPTLKGNTDLMDRYLTEIGKVDIYWTGSRLGQISAQLPPVGQNISRQAIVPWRYHFNTGTSPLLISLMVVTFSYTTVWWGWDEWEQMLDWMALHGINLPLAWSSSPYHPFLFFSFLTFQARLRRNPPTSIPLNRPNSIRNIRILLRTGLPSLEQIREHPRILGQFHTPSNLVR